MIRKVDWTERTGMEFPRLLLSPDPEAQVRWLPSPPRLFVSTAPEVPRRAT